MNTENIAIISQKMEALQKKVIELQEGDEFLRKMLNRLLRPFIIMLVEEKKDFTDIEVVSPDKIIFAVLDILHQKGVVISSNTLQAIQERYRDAIVLPDRVDWLHEVLYTIPNYSHPLITIRKIVFENLSEDGHIVSARESLGSAA